MTKCRDVMTTNPSCCVPSDTVETVAKIMKSENVGSLPVVENWNSKRIIGVISDRDLVTRVLAENGDRQNVIVDSVMTRNPVTCRTDDDLKMILPP